MCCQVFPPDKKNNYEIQVFDTNRINSFYNNVKKFLLIFLKWIGRYINVQKRIINPVLYKLRASIFQEQFATIITQEASINNK